MIQDQFWVHEFGEVSSAKDFAGRKINRHEQGQKTRHGWTLDHILPLALKGPAVARPACVENAFF